MHALIGCGRVAPNHIDAFHRIEGHSVTAVCGRNESTLHRFADAHGIDRRTTNYREILDDPTVRSVSILTDHAQHADLTRQALLAGKHVLVEKPLALKIRDAEQVVSLAEERGLVLGVVAQHRHDHLAEVAHRWIADGTFGQLLCMSAVLECRRDIEYYASSDWRGDPNREGGSALMNQAYHCLDLLTWFGGPVRAAGAVSKALTLKDHIDTEDTLAATLEFESGIVGSLVATASAFSYWRSRIEIIGSQGSFAFSIDTPPAILHASGSQAFTTAVEALSNDPMPEEEPAGINYYGTSHRQQVADFCRAIEQGYTPRASGSAGLTTLRAILDIYDKSEPSISLADSSANQAISA